MGKLTAVRLENGFELSETGICKELDCVCRSEGFSHHWLRAKKKQELIYVVNESESELKNPFG
jgi:hypothetical protein